MVDCPDDAAVLAFTRGDLAGDDLGQLDQHIDRCEMCRQLVVALTSTGARGDDDAVCLTAGSTLGRYRIESMIGRGATGRVYLAHDDQLDREVAIKVLVSGADDQLLAEAQAMARLQHPNVVAVHDVGRDKERVFLAMEHVSGGSLRQWLTTRRKPDELRAIFAAMADGLHAAHEAGLSHGDFKPDNVVIDEAGRPRVTDFGLAPFAQDVDDCSDLTTTRTGGPAGTPAYMAPEQWRGEAADPRSDQFSFFVTLVEAMTGQRPFAGSDIETLSKQVIAGRMELAGDIPTDLGRAIRRGLATEPEHRFASMAQVASALRSRPSARWPWLVAAAAAAAAAAVAVVVAPGLGAEPATTAQVEPAPTPLERQAAIAESAEVTRNLDSAEALLLEGRYDRAEDAIHRALADKPLPASSARAWLLQAAVLGQRGDYKGAQRSVDVAAATVDDLNEPGELAIELLHARALIELGMGEPQSALDRFEQALSRTRDRHGVDSPRLARALSHIGLAKKDLGDLAGSLAAHTEALARDERSHGADHPITARHHHNLGGVLRMLGRLDEAGEHYQRALALHTSSVGADHPTALMTSNSLGLVELDRGQLIAARRYFERAEAGLAQAGDARRARVLTNLAIVADKQRRRRDAARTYREARRVLVETRGADHPEVAAIDRALQRLQRRASKARQPGKVRPTRPAGPTTPSYGSAPTWTER